MPKVYLFTERGMTGVYFCGNQYTKNPSDQIRVQGDVFSFSDCVSIGFCKEFDTEKSANIFSKSEEQRMNQADNYASREMRNEEIYGTEGVDVDY